MVLGTKPRGFVYKTSSLPTEACPQGSAASALLCQGWEDRGGMLYGEHSLLPCPDTRSHRWATLLPWFAGAEDVVMAFSRSETEDRRQ